MHAVPFDITAENFHRPFTFKCNGDQLNKNLFDEISRICSFQGDELRESYLGANIKFPFVS